MDDLERCGPVREPAGMWNTGGYQQWGAIITRGPGGAEGEDGIPGASGNWGWEEELGSRGSCGPGRMWPQPGRERKARNTPLTAPPPTSQSCAGASSKCHLESGHEGPMGREG